MHSSLKAIVDAPALRLIQAIASLTSPDGSTITVPGYYDAIRAPTLEEQRLVNGMVDEWTAREPHMREALGVDRWIRLIREHLDRNGFGDIEIRVLGGYAPAQSSVESAMVQAAIGAYRKHGFDPSVAPRVGGSAPYYVFTDRLGLPMVAGGLGFGSCAHAPDEYMVVEPASDSRVVDLAGMEIFYVDLLYALAAAP